MSVPELRTIQRRQFRTEDVSKHFVRKSKRSSFDLITIPKFVHQTSLAIVPGEFGPPRDAGKGHRYQFKKAV